MSTALVCKTFVATFLLIALASCHKPLPTAPDRDAVAGAVSGFHDALAKGDRAAALALLAPDAQILESGDRQTRAEYESGHLAADIEFAKAVPSTHGAMIVRQEGTVAWTTTTSQSKGRFNEREINSAGTELMVLSKTTHGWRIRTIHWSGHPNR